MLFGKAYEACIPVFVPTVGRLYLLIRCERISEFTGDDIGKVYD